MTKTIKIIAIILALILLFIAISYFFIKPLYYRLFYFSDRIRGTVSVEIDGEKYDLKGSEVKGTFQNQTIRTGFKDVDEGANISIRAGEYGPYRLLITIDKLNITLECIVYQYNWWNVCDFDLDISIDSTTGKVKLSSSATVLNEKAEKTEHKNSSENDFFDEKITYYITSI